MRPSSRSPGRRRTAADLPVPRSPNRQGRRGGCLRRREARDREVRSAQPSTAGRRSCGHRASRRTGDRRWPWTGNPSNGTTDRIRRPCHRVLGTHRGRAGWADWRRGSAHRVQKTAQRTWHRVFQMNGRTSVRAGPRGRIRIGGHEIRECVARAARRRVDVVADARTLRRVDEIRVQGVHAVVVE